jgi:hypothetical protein
MRRKLTLALILALITLVVLPTAFVKRTAARTGLTVSTDGIYLPNSQVRVEAVVSGGTAPYTYQWGPPPISGNGHAVRIYCYSGFKPIEVTVTDANGEIGYYSGSVICCPSCAYQ